MDQVLVAGAARTDGTQRAFTEDQLKSVLRSCFDAGGNPNMIMVGAFNKQKLSGFTGGSTRFDQAEDRRLVTSIDVYESDFGTLQVAPNRFIRGANATAAKKGQDALVLEMDYFAVAFLRDFALQTQLRLLTQIRDLWLQSTLLSQETKLQVVLFTI